MTRLSVIIPTHNRAALLQRAIASCLGSGSSALPMCEIIVVDDASTDETQAVVAQHIRMDAHIRYLQQEKRGANQARNNGARAAVGEVLLFLDSDDELLPDGLAAVVNFFADPNVAAVCSAALRDDEPGPPRTTDRPRNLGPAYENCRGLFLAGTFAVRRDVFFAVGGFAGDCPSSQHTEFALRLIPYCEGNGLHIQCTNESTVRIHTHDNGHLRGSIHRLLGGGQYIVDAHRKQLQKSPKHYSDWCSVTGVYAAKADQYGEARRMLAEAVRWYPRKVTNVARLMLACCPPLARKIWRRKAVNY